MNSARISSSRSLGNAEPALGSVPRKMASQTSSVIASGFTEGRALPYMSPPCRR